MTELDISLGFLGRLLEVFQQKAFIFVEVNAGKDPPLCLTVLNRSRFDVRVEDVTVRPDNIYFEDKRGNKSTFMYAARGLFKNQILKPGQRINLFFKSDQIKYFSEYTFKLRYSTLFRNLKIPMLLQECTYNLKSFPYSSFERQFGITQT